MRYSEIQYTIKTAYPSDVQQWMLDCLEVAKKECIRFLTFAAFIDWACPVEETPANEGYAEYAQWNEED